MARYEIIDEPQTKSWGENLIVDPTIILFAAILVPLLWNPPYLGRFWIPAAWLLLNGYALGSATLGKEIATILAGAVAWFGVMFGAAFIINNEAFSGAGEDVYPYMVILQFGVFFLALYLVVFQQSQSHALYKYLRGVDK